MARIIGNIPNFINGISQQPAALRLPSQSESQVNCYSTVAKGLIKRPPTETITKVTASALAANTFVHFINRDTTERYVVLFDGAAVADADKVKVFDFDGNQKTVNFPNGTGYIPTNCRDNLEALTVADYTFIVNKSQAVAEGSATVATRPYECLMSFGTIQPGSTVKVFINGTERASLLISDTDPSDMDTHYVANNIKNQLVTNGYNGGNWSVFLTQNGGSVIGLQNTNADFDVEIRDASNGLGIKLIKDKVQYFEDLPREGMVGFKVEVAGDPVTGFGNYWVQFENNNIPVWQEAVKPGIKQGLDASTMPHQLVRETNGTFTFQQGTWDTREVGDDDNNSMPSFVGETINDIFFTEARLAFLAGENVTMSEAGEFFNFFRTTVTTLVDSDPIDVGTNHTKVSILRHAVPYQEQLLLFSDQTQFRLTKGDVLSPSTVGIEPITEFESSTDAKPRPVGNFVFFGVEKSDYASLREYYVADDSLRNDAREITGHIPEYLPAGITDIVGSSNEDIVILRSSGSATDNELYVYKYFWSGQEKIQSSWSKWTFPDVNAIHGYEFIRSALYLVLERDDGVYLEKIEMDTGAEDDTATGYVLCADRKSFTGQPGVSAAYDSGSDTTTFTFTQLEFASAPVVIGVEGNSDDYPPGYSVTLVGFVSGDDHLTVAGDATSDSFMFGLPYTAEYTLSEIVPKAGRDDTGGMVPVTEGRLNLLWLNFRYAFSGYFKITVSTQTRADNVYEFNGRTLGDAASNPINDLPIDASGTFRVPVYSKSDRATIKVSSDDVLPFRMISADWIANFYQRFRRG